MTKIIVMVLIPVSVIACSVNATRSAQTTSNTVGPTVTLITPTLTPTQVTANDAAEEVEIRDLVENFGKKLQTVSLLSPDAAQETEKEYSEFVSPSLLEMWISDVSKAPGRMVSSPWPDRIEITSLAKEGSDRYMIDGFVVEVTSKEVVNGGSAARIPVRMVVRKDQGNWLITEYVEER